MKKYFRDYLFLFSLAAVIIALDQWTKSIVRTQLPFGTMWSPWEWLTPYARIIHWNNTGAAFGMMQGYATVFMLLAIAVSLAIIYYYPQVSAKDWTLRIALGMQLAGALGNLIDRITQNGQVTDFISVGTFPVFNVADASISVGVVILLIGLWYKDRGQKKEELKPSEDGSTPSETNIPQESSRGE